MLLIGWKFTLNYRSTTQIWMVTRHQYGIATLVTQVSFHFAGKLRQWRRREIVCCFLRLGIYITTNLKLLKLTEALPHETFALKPQILTYALQNQVRKIAVKPGATKNIYLERKRVGFVKNNNESVSQTISCIWTDVHRILEYAVLIKTP